MATCHTLKFTLCLTIAFLGMSTLVTALTGILRINENHVAKLVITIRIEPSPSSVLYDAVQPRLRPHIGSRVLNRALSRLGHVLDLQIFTFQRMGFIGQLTAMLMRRIRSAVLLFSLPLVDLSLRSLGFTRSLLLSG